MRARTIHAVLHIAIRLGRLVEVAHDEVQIAVVDLALLVGHLDEAIERNSRSAARVHQEESRPRPGQLVVGWKVNGVALCRVESRCDVLEDFAAFDGI